MQVSLPEDSLAAEIDDLTEFATDQGQTSRIQDLMDGIKYINDDWEFKDDLSSDGRIINDVDILSEWTTL